MSSRLQRRQNYELCQNFKTLSNIPDGVFYEKKSSPILAIHFILYVYQGYEYASGLLNLFFRGSKESFLWFHGYTGKFDIYQTDYSIHSKYRVFPLLLSHMWNCNIQANKRLKNVEMINCSISYF